MANPQAENGHIDIANEIAEALMKTNLTSYQWRIIWAIWRKTYGWHKKEDIISVSQLSKMTGIKHQHISRSLKELCLMNIVTRTQPGANRQKVTISFQKDYAIWKLAPNRVTVETIKLAPNQGHTRTQPGTKLAPNQGDTKEKKETIKRKGGNDIPFCPQKDIVDLDNVFTDLKTGAGAIITDRERGYRPNADLIKEVFKDIETRTENGNRRKERNS